MATAVLTRPRARSACRRASCPRRAWLLTYSTLWTLTIGFAAIVCITSGGGLLVRELLRLKLSATANPSPSITAVVSIAVNNTLHSVWPLTLGLIGVQRRRLTRTFADALVLASLLVPALLVGGALGAYGIRVLLFLPHVPLEWAGIAIGAAGWLIERKRPLTGRERTGLLVIAVLLLICAASIETCLVPHT